MEAKVIAIANQKGGVGKTTTAINFASYLSELGYKILLLDFDPQANATAGIGVNCSQIKETIYDVLIGKTDITNTIYPTAFKNLHVIPASNALAGAEIEMTNMKKRESILSEKIKPLKNYYHYIIMDCAPSLGLLTINALTAANKVLIPLQCEYFALEGITQLLNTIKLVKDNLNPTLDISGILLTMYDSRTTLNKLVIDNAKEVFKNLVFDTVIPRNIRLAEAPSHGLPIALYQPKSKGSLSYYNLAKEFISREYK